MQFSLAMFLLISLLLCFWGGRSFGLFPGAMPEEGDYRHLYPVVCLSICPYEKYEHSLSHVLGLVEALRYPKDRMHISFFVDGHQDENIETSFSSSLIKWVSQLSKLYLSTSLKQVDRNWREEALVYARRKSCAYLFLMDSDNLLMQNSLKQLIDLDKNNVVVSPLLSAPFGSHSNVHGLLNEEFSLRKKLESIRVYYSRGPLLIYMKHKDADYLSFEESNVLNYQGNGHPISVFAFSAFVMNISILFNNHNFYGYLLDSAIHTPAEHRSILNSFLANLVSDSGPMPFPHSSVLEPQYPIATTFGFEKIFLINLKRRPERLRKMKEVLRLVGIQFELFEAVDGSQLTEADLSKLTFLPDYEDPHYKRPLKSGEIGCFLSHYKIWEQVVQDKLNRVIVLEDDVRFTENATKVLKGVMEDLIKTQLDWDFIYFGRKKMSPPGDEFFVRGHQYLSTVGYSYWTLGYALSQAGAKKLLEAKPLEKLMALDEFLPIVYNKHPNEDWKKHFEGHQNLLAFTVYPVVVQPERYTHEPGYVSDTEGSLVVANKNTTPTLSVEEMDDIEEGKQQNNFFSQIDSNDNDEL